MPTTIKQRYDQVDNEGKLGSSSIATRPLKDNYLVPVWDADNNVGRVSRIGDIIIDNDNYVKSMILSGAYFLTANIVYDASNNILSADIEYADGKTGKLTNVYRGSQVMSYFTRNQASGLTKEYSIKQIKDSAGRIVSKQWYDKRVEITGDIKPFCVKLNDEPNRTSNTGYQTIHIKGINLTLGINIAVSDGFEISIDETNWNNVLKLSSSFDGNLYIRTKKYDTLGEYTGYLSIFSSEIEERRIPLSGATGDGTSGNPYPVASAYQLNDVRNGLDKYYKQYCNITLDPNTHFPSIGTNSNKFTGTYDGNNYKIINFKQNQQGADSWAYGLFGYSSGTIKNVNLYGIIDIPSSVSVQTVGLLTGASISTLDNCHVFGSIKCKGAYIGGLVGFANNITNCSANVEIEALTGSEYVGLLIGRKWYTIMSNCRATGKITGSAQYVGGMLGQNTDNSVNKEIENSYCNAYINMTTATNIGGFIGKDEFINTDKTSKYTNCYCNTIIEGAGTKKGFIGAIVDGCTSEANGCVWNKELSGVDTDTLPDTVGYPDKEMRLEVTFTGLSWSKDIWCLIDESYPYLKWE